jgi:hypothetical protein
MLAHGFQVIDFLAAVVLIGISIAIFLFTTRKKPLVGAVIFAVVVVGLCLFLLYLILVPQR